MYAPAPTQCRRARVAGGGSLGAAAVAVAGGGGAAAAASFAHKGCYAPSDASCNIGEHPRGTNVCFNVAVSPQCTIMA